MPAAVGLCLPTVGTSATRDALPVAMTRAPMADTERQLMVALAGLDQEQDHVPPLNIEWLDESHRAYDDDCYCGTDSESGRDDICDKSFDANLPEEAALCLHRTAEAAATGFNEIAGDQRP